jgi:hypothetical protein
MLLNPKSGKGMYFINHRDENKCVLTGETDQLAQTKSTRGFQVAHFVPQSLLDEKKDSSERIERKSCIRSFILRLCSWLPNDFFDNIDVCDNGMLLNYEAHRLQEAFEWFVVMETGADGSTIYKAMQVEDNGLLKEWTTGRKVSLATGGFDLTSSYNQPMFIGNGGGHPKPAEIYVRLHELLARIFKMRGQAGYYQYDSDDEECEVDMVKHTYLRQDTYQTLAIIE